MSFIDARSLLFVPGDRPERFPKADASGADVIIIDLEDAVSAPLKDVARTNAVAWLTTHPNAAVRINAIDTEDFGSDVAALSGISLTVMLAKTERGAQVHEVRRQLPRATVIALIESARGVLNASKIARAGATRLAFGNVDLATDLAVDPADRTALATARGALVLASASEGIAGPIDGVTTDLRNRETIADDSRYAASLGFAGKLCIHPAQVDAVNAAFSSTEAELEWARGILQAMDSAGPTAGAIALNGQMIDAPVVERASRLLRGV